MSSQDSPSPEMNPGFIEIGTEGQAQQGFLDRHFKLILILAIALLVGLFGWITWQWMEQQAKTKAADALALATDQEELKAVSQDHQGKPAAGTALLQLAAQYSTQGQEQQARETWQEFLTDYPKHPLRSQAILALASSQRASGEEQLAEQTLQALPEQNSASLRIIAALQKGDALLAQGQEEAALSAWTQVQESDWQKAGYLKRIVEDRITLIRAGVPELVEQLPSKSQGEIEQEEFMKKQQELQKQLSEGNMTENFGAGLNPEFSTPGMLPTQTVNPIIPETETQPLAPSTPLAPSNSASSENTTDTPALTETSSPQEESISEPDSTESTPEENSDSTTEG